MNQGPRRRAAPLGRQPGGLEPFPPPFPPLPPILSPYLNALKLLADAEVRSAVGEKVERVLVVKKESGVSWAEPSRRPWAAAAAPAWPTLAAVNFPQYSSQEHTSVPVRPDASGQEAGKGQ